MADILQFTGSRAKGAAPPALPVRQEPSGEAHRCPVMPLRQHGGAAPKAARKRQPRGRKRSPSASGSHGAYSGRS
jgi:hypothetical protein